MAIRAAGGQLAARQFHLGVQVTTDRGLVDGLSALSRRRVQPVPGHCSRWGPTPPGRNAVHNLVDTHGHVDCCYVAEVGRVGPACHHRHAAFETLEITGRQFSIGRTVETYAWVGNILDCSIGEAASTVLPSTALRQVAGLTFDMRGPSWLDASKPVAFLLADLGVTKSYSRPHTSNDNRFSESQFRTLKYRPEFPATFANLPDAWAFCRRFFGW